MKLLVAFVTLLLPYLINCNEPIQVMCNWDVYGRPSHADAQAIAGLLPFIKLDPETQAEAIGIRLFSEPAFLPGKFSALLNLYDRPMVQIPRIWRWSE